jgi:hypothetical protein
MSDYDMKIHSNPDAQAWAKFFIQTKEKASWQIEDIDESLMLGWFANAMMAMHDHLEPQRTWVDLTDEEIDNINYTSAHMLAREVLAKFKEKNNGV